MFSEVMRYILDLGPTVMLPIVIIIFSKILGMKAGDCFKAGLHIGIGFVGIGLVIGLMLDSIGPAAKAMAENFDLNLHVVDVGWPGSSPMTWASQIALVAIPIAILVNVAMLLTRMTRVVNVDIWNIWHMTFTGALLLGHTAVVSASLIFIPLTILIAVCVPGNQVLPFGDLATIGFFVAMAVAVHRGNLFRTLISGVIIMSITLWIATQTIGLHTQLAANAGALKAGGMVASMDQGGSPITWLLIQVFSPQNIPGFIVIGAIYLTGIFMTWRRARGFIKQEKAVLAE
ncbi:TPA: hypothetical protein OF592_000101 [Escherichia coli]|nr:hypothetical protein [Escherichia coli]